MARQAAAEKLPTQHLERVPLRRHERYPIAGSRKVADFAKPRFNPTDFALHRSFLVRARFDVDAFGKALVLPAMATLNKGTLVVRTRITRTSVAER